MKNKLFWAAFSAFLLFLLNCETQTVKSGGRKIAKAGKITAVGELKTSRAAHTATVLNDGKVLIAGGFGGGEKGLKTAEIYDPATNKFSSANNMNVARSGHTATFLPDGKILIAGGFNGDYLDAAEIFDPKTKEFTAIGKLTTPRSEHIAVLLENGKVLLAGGVGTNWTFLESAEIFDPLTNSFRRTGNMIVPRESHTATLLENGQVLITGGHRGRRSAIVLYRSAEIYDPVSGTFAETAGLTIKRHKHDAVLLEDGRVLIVGGSDERDSQGAYATAEIFDPKTKSFALIGDMNSPRYKLRGTTVLLKSGKILIAGGAKSAEIYDAAADKFEIVRGAFKGKLLFSTATLLKDGRVLIAGGYGDNINVGAGVWIFSE